jgi:hypothetical protein
LPFKPCTADEIAGLIRTGREIKSIHLGHLGAAMKLLVKKWLANLCCAHRPYLIIREYVGWISRRTTQRSRFEQEVSLTSQRKSTGVSPATHGGFFLTKENTSYIFAANQQASKVLARSGLFFRIR